MRNRKQPPALPEFEDLHPKPAMPPRRDLRLVVLLILVAVLAGIASAAFGNLLGGIIIGGTVVPRKIQEDVYRAMCNDDLPEETPDILPVKGKGVLIVTLNIGTCSPGYKKALENHRSYASCHGYGFLNAVSLTSSNKSVHPYMQKGFALKEVLSSMEYSHYEYIVWVDRDAIFMDLHTNIYARIEQIHKATGGPNEEDATDLYLSVERWAWLNSGVLLFRNRESSRRLVDNWIAVYESREHYYKSDDTFLIGGVSKRFRDLFKREWSCEDQGAMIALLAGYPTRITALRDGFNSPEKDQVLETDRFDGLGVPHPLHQGHADWAAQSSREILAPKYQASVKVVADVWLNTNPWTKTASVGPAFIYHFNGQPNKPALIREYSVKVRQCPGRLHHSLGRSGALAPQPW